MNASFPLCVCFFFLTMHWPFGVEVPYFHSLRQAPEKICNVGIEVIFPRLRCSGGRILLLGTIHLYILLSPLSEFLLYHYANGIPALRFPTLIRQVKREKDGVQCRC